MKAYHVEQYGDPEEVLTIIDTDKPVPADDEVLVKVHSTTINDYDWCLSTGTPLSYRLFFGIFKPKKQHRTPGMELAGVVEDVGKNVTSLSPGDAVYCDTSDDHLGTFAEYICLNENTPVLKPESMSFEVAATIPHASMLALQGLRDLGKIENGQKVLINGGGGGVGAFGLQIAKQYKCEVTGVDTGDKLQSMLESGYDNVIDYKKQDFTRLGQKYDLILDCKTNRSPWTYLRALNTGGRYITVGGRSGKLLQLVALKPLISMFSSKSMHMLTIKTNQDLDYVNEMHEAGKLKTVIDGPYRFDEVPMAVRRFGAGKHYGKIVIQL